MDFNKLSRIMWVGFLIGVILMLSITIILIPVSYAMNKFIYHGPFMRFCLGIIALMLPVISFVAIGILLLTGQMNRVHYFGMIPMVKTGDPIEPTGYFAFIMKIFVIVFHPFCMFYGGGDVEGFKDTIKQCLVSEEAETREMTLNGVTFEATKGAVCEQFFEAARKAGAENDKALWQAQMNAMQASGISDFIFQ